MTGSFINLALIAVVVSIASFNVVEARKTSARQLWPESNVNSPRHDEGRRSQSMQVSQKLSHNWVFIDGTFLLASTSLTWNWEKWFLHAVSQFHSRAFPSFAIDSISILKLPQRKSAALALIVNWKWITLERRVRRSDTGKEARKVVMTAETRKVTTFPPCLISAIVRPTVMHGSSNWRQHVQILILWLDASVPPLLHYWRLEVCIAQGIWLPHTHVHQIAKSVKFVWWLVDALLSMRPKIG